MSGRRYRRAWMGDEECEHLARREIMSGAREGDMIEDWVWNTSWQTCRRMLQRLSEFIDLQAAPADLQYQRLWVKVLADRVANGDRL